MKYAPSVALALAFGFMACGDSPEQGTGASSGPGTTSSTSRDAAAGGEAGETGSTLGPNPNADASGGAGEDGGGGQSDEEGGPQAPTVATPVFSYPNGFASQPSDIFIRDAKYEGSNIRLIYQDGHSSGIAWYRNKVPPTPFTTQFTFQPLGLGSSPVASGMTFAIQNTQVSTGADPGYAGIYYAGDANMCGFGGDPTQHPPIDAIAIKFDANNVGQQAYPNGGFPSSTGLYFNGDPHITEHGNLGLVPFNDLAPYGINFYSGDTYQVNIVYDGSLLTMVILDTNTHAQARAAWPLNLANTTNPDGNYVGFTSGTSKQGHFELMNWSYWSGYNTRLETPAFSPPPGQYSGAQSVTLDCPSGATCYYTTNGLLPTSSSTKYQGPISVNSNAVIKAVAIQPGYTDSLVGDGAYQINSSNIINFPDGFAAGDLIPIGIAYLSGSAYRVTDTTTGAAGATWFPVPVNVTSFTTDFKLQYSHGGQGMAFVIQNSTPAYSSPSLAGSIGGGPTVLGYGNNGMGYGGVSLDSFATGIQNSVAIAFDHYAVPNSVGLYTNGATPEGAQVPTGLTFDSGHTLDVAVSYSGTTLSFAMADTVTGAKFTRNFTADIPKAVGGNTAYVGFTGGTGGAASIQSVQSWIYSN